MSDYSAVAPPPQQNFNTSSAFAAALQRAKQIAAKINPTAGAGQKRPLEDGQEEGLILEPDSKKLATSMVGNVPRPMGQSMGQPALGGGPQINEDIKVPDKMVGLIIGRGGEQITRLQVESGCKIQMAPDSAGQPERVCSLSGSREAITRAKELIMNIVHQRGRSEGIAGLDLGPGLGQGANGNAGRNFVEIMVPGPKVGLIIGKGGETIKQLQERSGAKMVVIQDGPNQEQEKPLRISGDPAKVEYAKQLVYDLIAEKEMQAFNRGGSGGGGQGGGGGRDRGDRGGQGFQGGNDYGNGGGGGGGGGNEVEVLVPRAAVGVVIGKGGDMIKKIQAETGARVQFQQARDEGPGERRCYLSGKPQNVEQARQRIEELIDSVIRRDGDGNGGGRNGGGNRGNRDRFDGRGNGRNGGNDYQGWDDRRQSAEVTFTVPASKCGVIIGRGGDTIKQINMNSGAHCELDRRSPAHPNGDKTFIIRGEPEQIEAAKRIISDKVQLPINFVAAGGNVSNALPTGYNPQGWGVPGFQQQWNGPQQAGNGADGGQQAGVPGGSVQMPGGAGQPDYSLQWAEYYRSLGMHREAEMIEQQSKTKGPTPTSAPTPSLANAANPTHSATAQAAAAAAAAGGAQPAANGQPDYSAQWADYYRSLGKHKEAEAIEAQMKNKSSAPPAGTQPNLQSSQASMTTAYQQSYGAYQGQTGYYGAQAGQTASVPQGAAGQYNFGYGYGGAPGTQGQAPPQTQQPSSD